MSDETTPELERLQGELVILRGKAEDTPPEKPFRMRWRTMDEVCTELPESPPWVAPYLITGAMTEFDGYAKAGKTSFLLAMMRAIVEGEKFIGQQCVKSPVIYLNESPEISLKEGALRASIQNRRDIHVLTFAYAAHVPWLEQLDEAARMAKKVGAGVLVIDTLACWTRIKGDDENSAGHQQQAVEPIQTITVKYNLATVFARHTKKSGGEIGKAGRGSGAVSGIADIICAMERVPGQPNQHRIEHTGRFGVGEVQVEYDDGDFRLIGTPAEAARQEKDGAIISALPADRIVTAKELVETMKGQGTKISIRTLQIALSRLADKGLIERHGRGTGIDPFQFGRANGGSAR